MSQQPPNTTVPAAPTLRVLIAAGGTAGHLAPALAVADALRDAGHAVSFAASSGRRDAELIGQRGYDAQLFAIGGLPRRIGIGQVTAVARAIGAVFACLRIVHRIKPDVLLAGGGFVSAPMSIAAWLQRVPVVATEADAHLGLANRISGLFARRLCTGYPLAAYRARQEVVGRPVDERFTALARELDGGRHSARERLDLPDDARVLAIVGGSGGATHLNTAAWDAWGADEDPAIEGAPLWILHVTGRRDHDMIAQRGVASDRYRVIDYCDEMPDLLAAADLVVSRPGGSVFELAALGRAALLVPSPNVTGNHQELNARHFVSHGAAAYLDDASMTGETLRSAVADLLGPEGRERRAQIELAIAALARPWAAARIATIVAHCGAATSRRRAGRRSDTSTDTHPLAGRRLHMLGVGGAGVSALALLCKAWGARVDGCDQAESGYGALVRSAGIDVAIGHDAAHVVEGMEIIASSALPTDHPELARARKLGCPVVLRGELLGELTRLRADTVVVAGAHGKSTTTGLLAHAASGLGLDPAAALGATIPGLGPKGSATNVLTGRGPFLVEGDESDRTLLHLTPRIAIVTNIERDHHHTFATDEELEQLFAEWVREQRPEVLVAGPGPELDRLAIVQRAAGRRVVRFGADERELAALEQRLALPGRHNALNALGAIEALVALGVDKAEALGAMRDFTGVGRRFEEVGEARGVLVVDDYAHHPTEVAATIAAARGRASERGGRVLVVFQPHLFSRTEALWEQFARALAGADRAWVLPIYGAREAPIEGVSERLIADEIVERAPLVYAGIGVADPATGDVATIVDEISDGDVLITMGAGSITQLAPRLLAAIREAN